MRPAELLNELRNRGVVLHPTPEGIRYEAPRGVLTAELKATLAMHKAELLRLLAVPIVDADAGELAAVKLVNTVIGDVWLVADPEVLAEHPDIIRARLPVFLFAELEQLRGKTPAELKAIAMVKATFPTSRVLQ